MKSWFFEEPVTALILTDRDDTFAVALGSRLIFWEPKSDTRREHGFKLPDWPKVRSNDARADPRGSLWLGSMRNNVNPDGSSGKTGGKDGVLYRIDADSTVSEWKHGVGIGNTMAWSPDQSTFYFGDTLANTVWTYDYNPATGAITTERPFLTGFERGSPDGSQVDSGGFLWNCRYEGQCIVRVHPSGSIEQVVEMPVSNITSCTFGGPDLKTLYVTTAAAGAPADERLAGGLFAIETEIAGQPENRFRVFSR